MECITSKPVYPISNRKRALRAHILRILCFLVAAGAGGGAPVITYAQSFSLGADLVSRYVWRGLDIGESVSIQPRLSVTSGPLEVGTWASYAANPESASANEHDLWVSLSAGPLTLGVNDYYFPNLSSGFFDFTGDGDGAHFLEHYAVLTGPSSFPVILYGAVFVYNDPDHSVYVNASLPFTVDGLTFAAGLGASAGRSAMYGTHGFGVIDLSLTASRSIQVTDRFAIPLRISYVLNPTAEKSYLVFGISI